MELIKKTMPRDMMAERAVIGSMMIDREAINVAMETLSGDDFYFEQNKVVFDAICQLEREGQPVDIVTLHTKLGQWEHPELMRPEYLKELLDAVPTSANVKYYAGIVYEKSVLRRLIIIAEHIEKDCYAQAKSMQIVNNVSEIMRQMKEELKND